jgi:hypothetical protein
MSIEILVENMFSEINEELRGKNVFVKFKTSFDIDEEPENYNVWTSHKGSLERDWSDTWEANIIHELRNSRVIFVTNTGRYETVDFEFLESSLVASGQGAAYEGVCQSWVEMPHDADPEALKTSNIEITGSFGTYTAPVENLQIVDID